MSNTIYANKFCNLCNSPAIHLSGRNKYWCAKNPSSCPGVKEIRRLKSQEKYGTDNPSHSQKIKDKISIANSALSEDAKLTRKATVLKKYGVESVMHVQEFVDTQKATLASRSAEEINNSNNLRKETCIEKYGVEFVNQSKGVQEKSTNTNILKYGTTWPNQSLIVRLKTLNTCLEKYGVENPSQDPGVIETIRKQQYRTKIYIFPSGKEVKIQGYENKALDELLISYNEDDIVVETMLIPRIQYTGVDNKIHYYFPDIYIPKENLIIEVKSEYTYTVDNETALLKRQACINAGYNFKFMIYK